MLFNSYSFFIFFALVLFFSRLLKSWTARKTFLLCTSYVFYAAWNPPFVVLLWISTLVDWSVSKKIHEITTPRTRKRYLYLSLCVNLGMLSYFKYSGFFIDNLNAFLSASQIPITFGTPNIILPVGISFYTFQTMSYTIDIYKGNMKPWHSFLDYALYVTFFPQLVAGPIVRATDFLPQCNGSGLATKQQMGWGLSLFVIGLFSKVVIADALMSPIAERVFDVYAPAGFLAAWAGTLAFSTQIFCDFFGYSTCAIGVALCLGFALPDNFRFPYAAIGFSDFWRRWHISLSSWLRDYLYIPLGGNRKGSLRTYINLALTMLLGGLWHGASWMFVIWGGLHGTYLIAERLLVQSKISTLNIWKTIWGQFTLALFTFGLIAITWVFFRAPDIGRAFAICTDMLSPYQFHSVMSALLFSTPLDFANSVLPGRMDYFVSFGVSLALIGVHFYLRNTSLEMFFQKRHPLFTATVMGLMLYLTIISMTGEDRAFIYFQF